MDNNNEEPPHLEVNVVGQRLLDQGQFAVVEKMLQQSLSLLLMYPKPNGVAAVLKGTYVRMVTRNNLGVVQQLRMPKGVAQFVFRKAVDDGWKSLRSLVGKEDDESLRLRKCLVTDIETVRYNLGCCWLMDPKSAAVAFKLFSGYLRMHINDAMYWFRAAEAAIMVVTFADPAQSATFLFGPIPLDFDLLDYPQPDPEYQKVLDHLDINYCLPGYRANGKTLQPTLVTAQHFLAHASRLWEIYSMQYSDTPEDPCYIKLSPEQIATMLANAYVSIRLNNYQRAAVIANLVFNSPSATPKDRIYARLYVDFTKFMENPNDYHMFHQLSAHAYWLHASNEDAAEYERLIPLFQPHRKYAEILGILMSQAPTSLRIAHERLQEFITAKISDAPRALITMFIYLAFNSEPSMHVSLMTVKYENLHRQVNTLSKIYQSAVSKRVTADFCNLYEMCQEFLEPPTEREKVMWKLMDEFSSVVTMDDFAPSLPKLNPRLKPTPAYLKLFESGVPGGRGIRIPL